MSYNKFLNNKVSNSCDFMSNLTVLSMQNRDSNDYFFNKSDLDKMENTSRILLNAINYVIKSTITIT